MVTPAGFGAGFGGGEQSPLVQNPDEQGLLQWWLRQQQGKPAGGKPGSIGPEQGAMVQPGMLPPMQTAGIQLPMSGGGMRELIPNMDSKTGVPIVQEIQHLNRSPTPGDYGQLAMMPDPRAFLQQQMESKLARPPQQPVGVMGPPTPVGLGNPPQQASWLQGADAQKIMADIMGANKPQSEGDIARAQQLKAIEAENKGRTDVANIQQLGALKAMYAQVLAPLIQQGSDMVGPTLKMLGAANTMLGEQNRLPVGVNTPPPEVGVKPPEPAAPPAHQKTPAEIALEDAMKQAQATTSEDNIANAVGSVFGVTPTARDKGPSSITGGHYDPERLFSTMLGAGNIQKNPQPFLTRLLNQQGNPGLERVMADLQGNMVRRLYEGGQLNPSGAAMVQPGAEYKMPGGTILRTVADPEGKGNHQFEITTPDGRVVRHAAGGRWWHDSFPTFRQGTRERYLQEANATEPLLLEAMRRFHGGQ